MRDEDALDAASELTESGPAANQEHSIGNYGSSRFKTVEVPEKPEAKMSGVPPEQWARPVKKN